MKVLHQVGGRSMVGHVLTAVRASSRSASWPSSAPSASRWARTSRRFAPDVVLAVQEVLDGTAGAVRVAVEASRPTGHGGRGHRGHPAAGGREPEGVRRRARGGRARGEHPVRGGRRPLRLRPDRPRRRRRRRGDRRGEGRDAAAARHPRDQQRHPGLRRGVPARRAAADRQRQRQGRVLPDRHRGAGPRRRPDRRRLPDRRRDADRGRQRPRPARRARPRDEPPDRHPLDARGRHGDGPRDHLDRRRRPARARRHDPARHPAARRHRRGRGRRHRPGHHAEGLRDRRRGPRRAHPRRARGDRRPGRPSGRSPTCDPAPCSAPAARSARSSR